VGKTTFVRELGYGMAQRNLYRNGIYYFSLKLIREKRYNNNLQLLMQEQFGSEFEKGPSLFF
jgi:predicted AAA+ superfamily ATPase